jgi:hypothetical protein
MKKVMWKIISLLQTALKKLQRPDSADFSCFLVVRPEMELDSLHRMIAQAIQTSSGEMKESNENGNEIEERAEQQRMAADIETMKPIVTDTTRVVCFVCGRAACDSGFESFPCKRTVHTSCYLVTHPEAAEGVIEELQ